MFQIIQDKTIKPIQAIALSTPPSHIRVEFKDGVCIQEKIDTKLRLFLTCVKSLNFKRIEGDKSHCVNQTTSLFSILGICPGDAVMFYQRDVSLPILFS